MAQQPEHHPNCSPDHRNRQSGATEDGHNFVNNYTLAVDFDLECLGCCFAYLRGRNYQEVLGALYDRVHYSQENLATPGARIRGDTMNSYVKVPRRGRRGQIATGHDLNLGELSVRPFANSRTYQLYSETGALSVGFVANARMESVAIDVVRPDELVNIYLSYADAALVELYREQNNQESLSRAEATGYLLLRNPEQEGH
ncbi:uncharacterized protein LOC133183339 [Saccostrea echinata]|uniref:uncharacterized protein LOC133183339 n=1 Tax=Saccostrea echinata TaxID=191078 RepID=UPI002A7F50BB|nr:uncharacterized protein LOC133183339 [Saccostrea echinata]